MLPAITIVAIDKMKNEHCRALAAEYSKRLKLFGRIKVVELAAEAFRTDGQRSQAIEREGERIIDFIAKQKGARIIALDERGREFTSVDFAKNLEQQNDSLVIIIGGALGLSQAVKKRAIETWALGKSTMPHELARVVLLEQLYRAGTINTGKTYHY